MAYYTPPIRPDELYHHGILGMKWGIRRFQNYDGTWKNAKARDRHVTQQKKSENHVVSSFKRSAKISVTAHNMRERKKIRKMNPGMTAAEATEAQKKKAEAMKKVAIGAGVAIGAATAVYLARTMSRTNFDHVIKEGMQVQTLHMDPDRMKSGMEFYTAHRDIDKLKYTGIFGEQQGLFGQHTGEYKNKIVGDVAKDIKVAGRNSSKKVYDELMKNDKEFADGVMKVRADSFDFAGNIVARNDYDKFDRQVLMGNTDDAKKVKEKFYNALKEKGYGGVADVNDRKNSGFDTKADIIFDKDAIGKTTVSKLTFDEVAKAKKKTGAIMVADTLTRPGTVGLSAAVALKATSASENKKIQQNYKKKKSNQNGR